MTRRFPTLFWRQSARYAWRHPLLTALNVVSVALGVTVFLAIQIANHGALDSFRSAAKLTTGRADLEIRGALDDAIFPAVAATPGVRAATPLVEGIVTLPGRPGEYLRILGIDPLTGSDIFAFKLDGAAGAPLDLERWLADPEALAVQPGREGPLTVLAGDSARTLTPTFVFRPDDIRAAGDPRIAAMDIGWAQELLGQAGRLSSIQILLTDPADAAAVTERLRALVPADATVAPPAARSSEMETMLAAFQLNLNALAVVSVAVGIFLISNSVAASVTRRRAEIAILRACGTTRGEIRLLFLGQTLIEAIAGVILALALAPVLAELVARPLSLTISSLYEIVRIQSLSLTPLQIVSAFAIGLGAALAAAWMPASEAARLDPARILHPGAGMELFSPLRWRGLVGGLVLLLAALGLSVAALRGGHRFLGFGAAAAVLAGFSFMVPWLAAAMVSGVRHFGLIPRLAGDHLVRSLHRNALTIASLAAAVAMTISVTVMIYSFRRSVERWINHTLLADLYVAPAVNEIAGLQAFLPEDIRAFAATLPQVASTSTFREIPLHFQGGRTALAVLDGAARGDLDFTAGGPAGPDDVVVSESFAHRFGITAGARIPLPTPAGEKTFLVSGVCRDFTRDSGTVLMRRELFDQFWRDPRIHSLALKLADPAQAKTVADAIRARLGEQGQLLIYDNAALRARIMDIFDRTFAVTLVLRAIAIVIAMAGVFFSLNILVLEREREIGVLRSVGASRGQVLGIFLGEAFLIGLIATVSGLASGGLLAMVLTWVINQAFFGWTIALSYPLATLAATPLWLIPVAVLAALLPAWRATRVPPAVAVRFE